MSAIADKPFRIVDYMPRVFIYQDNEDDWAPFEDTRWEILSASALGCLALFQSKIDIAGWTKDGLTAFFAAIGTQRPSSYITTYASSPAGGVMCQDRVLVTDVPLDDPADVPAQLWEAGFSYTSADWMTIKYARADEYVQSTNAPNVMTLNDSTQFGSSDPTASGTLYVYRYVTVAVPTASSTNVNVTFPELRLILEGVATEEPEFVYLTRLRRSFELRENG